MSVTDIFSKRQKRLRGEVPDVYQYDNLPHELRVKVILITSEAFGQTYYASGTHYSPNGVDEIYALIDKTLRHEYGTLELVQNARTDRDAVESFFLETLEIEKAIDVIELLFQFIDPSAYGFDTLKIAPEESITELNHRFREHGVGYQYESGQIIRVNSQYLHSEAVQPALKILSASMYEGANDEFLGAHKHFRAKRYKECLNDCLKAFESCLKAICKERGWVYGAKDTANPLIDIVLKNGLIPEFMKSHISGLRSALASGVPTLRNELGGHGQGVREISVPEHIAAYALHLTASNILLLAKAEENLPPDIPF